MKLKTLAILCGLFSANTFAQSYFQLGVEYLDYKIYDSVESSHSFAGLSYGYSFNDTVALQVKGLIPVNQEEGLKQFDTYRNVSGQGTNVADYTDVLSNSYTTILEADPILSVSMKLDLPLSQRFEAFLNLGYTYTKMNYEGYLPFEDHTPATDVSLGLLSNATSCELTGQESLCGSPVTSFDDEVKKGGFTYGLGFQFNYADNTKIVLAYNQYVNSSDLDVGGASVYYSWQF